MASKVHELYMCPYKVEFLVVIVLGIVIALHRSLQSNYEKYLIGGNVVNKFKYPDIMSTETGEK